MRRDAWTHRPHGLAGGLLTLALALSGCAPPGPAVHPPPTPPGPTTQTPAPRALPGYEARVDSLDRMDASVLQGKRIVLDRPA